MFALEVVLCMRISSSDSGKNRKSRFSFLTIIMQRKMFAIYTRPLYLYDGVPFLRPQV